MAKKIGKYFVYCHTNIPMELMNVFFNYVIFYTKGCLDTAPSPCGLRKQQNTNRFW